MEADNYLAIWHIYVNTREYPGLYVARKWLIKEQAEPTAEVVTSTTLQGVRGQLPWGLHRMMRAPGDPHEIVESWF